MLFRDTCCLGRWHFSVIKSAEKPLVRKISSLSPRPGTTPMSFSPTFGILGLPAAPYLQVLHSPCSVDDDNFHVFIREELI